MFLARKHFKKSNSDNELKLEQVESGETVIHKQTKTHFTIASFVTYFSSLPPAFALFKQEVI